LCSLEDPRTLEVKAVVAASRATSGLKVTEASFVPARVAASEKWLEEMGRRVDVVSLEKLVEYADAALLAAADEVLARSVLSRPRDPSLPFAPTAFDVFAAYMKALPKDSERLAEICSDLVPWVPCQPTSMRGEVTTNAFMHAYNNLVEETASSSNTRARYLRGHTGTGKTEMLRHVGICAALARRKDPEPPIVVVVPKVAEADLPITDLLRAGIAARHRVFAKASDGSLVADRAFVQEKLAGMDRRLSQRRLQVLLLLDDCQTLYRDATLVKGYVRELDQLATGMTRVTTILAGSASVLSNLFRGALVAPQGLLAEYPALTKVPHGINGFKLTSIGGLVGPAMDEDEFLAFLEQLQPYLRPLPPKGSLALKRLMWRSCCEPRTIKTMDVPVSEPVEDFRPHSAAIGNIVLGFQNELRGNSEFETLVHAWVLRVFEEAARIPDGGGWRPGDDVRTPAAHRAVEQLQMQRVEAFLTAADMARDEDGYRREDLEKVLCNAAKLQRWVDAGYLSMEGRVGHAGNGVAVAYTPLVANAFVEVMGTASWKPVDTLAVMVPAGKLAKKLMERIFARTIFSSLNGLRILRTALVGKPLRALERKEGAVLMQEFGEDMELEELEDHEWPASDVEGNRKRCVGKVFRDDQSNNASDLTVFVPADADWSTLSVLRLQIHAGRGDRKRADLWEVAMPERRRRRWCGA
jgi:hypothetical protein